MSEYDVEAVKLVYDLLTALYDADSWVEVRSTTEATALDELRGRALVFLQDHGCLMNALYGPLTAEEQQREEFHTYLLENFYRPPVVDIAE